MFETIHRNGELGGAEWKALMHGQEEQRVKGATGTVPDHHEAQLIAKRMRERGISAVSTRIWKQRILLRR